MSTIDNAVKNAAAGSQVAIIGRRALDYFDEAATISRGIAEVRAIHRANGLERILFSNGGRLSFLVALGRARGMTLHHAYLTEPADADTFAFLAPCFATIGRVNIQKLVTHGTGHG